MRIVQVVIRNFRGIAKLDWCPAPGINCLIGPGDSTKTTILDAIEFALTPRANFLGSDSDFYNLDLSVPVAITVTIVGMPTEFCTDTRYGLHLRGWDEAGHAVVDEPGAGLIDALSIRVKIDPTSLECQWGIYNDRLADDDDPPSLRFKDARELATTRLGPFAERHLGWGRQSILNRIGDGGKMTEQLAAASRAARTAFSKSDKAVFAFPTARAEELSKQFSVRVRTAFTAELDIHGAVISSGGVTLHDGDLPLRTLGTGSARLIVSALQHNANGSHIALVDEIEHGLEPHRIARLLKYLCTPPVDAQGNPPTGKAAGVAPQIFLTTHSVVVIRELQAHDIQAVRSDNGETTVRSVAAIAESPDAAQRHLRAFPDGFLARRVLVGEGKTECGLLRGLDGCWTKNGKDSFALRGVIAVSGNGVPAAVTAARHLADLKYETLALLDSDQPIDAASLSDLKAAGCTVIQWPGAVATDEQIFNEVPWDTVRELVAYASTVKSAESVLTTLNATCKQASLPEVSDLSLPASQDTPTMRGAIGKTAKAKDWFKDIERAERVAEIIYPSLASIADKPLALHLAAVRAWIDG
ncbi:AAA family ATPase [Phenylobacterium sp. LjRoot225]|uniref:ATP-dependent nuclease n=1 Tax=Phenylobacterium sp. LjRoot225 TaxID=3342285 RepID=UPI003ED15534